MSRVVRLPAASVLAVLSLAALATAARGELHPVLMDGRFDDWDGIAPAYSDPAGDGGSSGIDLGRLWIADDDMRLFMRVEVGREILLNTGHNLVLYLDTDMNAQTGLAVGGIGAELEWRFGTMRGTFRWGSSTTTVYHDNVGMIGLPSVTDSQFELCFLRSARPNGSNLLFPGPALRALFVDTASGGDRLPDAGGTLSYAFDQGSLPADTATEIPRILESDLRLSTFNVENDAPWNPSLQASFGRMISAVAPDILAFQEIYNHTPQETAALVEIWLPSGEGESWFSAGNQDCKIISRYPVIGTWPLDGNLAALLDTVDRIGTPLLLISAHLPCCDNNAGRQREIDRILSFLRDVMNPGGAITLPPGTPYVIAGDLNLVGDAQQLRSLLTGDVVDEATFGSDFESDWDGTILFDTIARHTARRLAYTWRSDASDFWPGRLDFVIYTDSVLHTAKQFTLYTPEMAPADLAANGLLSGDSYASDHLLFCADFRPGAVSESTDAGQIDGVLFQVEPSPGAGRARLRIAMPEAGLARVSLYDPAGRLVAEPLGDDWVEIPAGERILSWDGRGSTGERLAPGVYFFRLQVRAGAVQTARTFSWPLLR